MHQQIREQNIERIESFRRQLAREIVIESIPLQARYGRSVDPVAFEDRLNLDYVDAQEGDVWGDAWGSAWFNLQGMIPNDWKGSAVSAQVELNGEALVFDETGCPVYGLSGGSVFIKGYSKEFYLLHGCCVGGEEVNLWIEAAANHIMGIGGSPRLGEKGDADQYNGRVNRVRLVRYDLEKWHLRLDLDVLCSMLMALGRSPRRNRIIKVVCEALDLVQGQGAGTNECRAYLKQLWTPANASDLKVIGTGHAHIDTAWLWPVKESVRKCARTFASQLALIEKYPDYVFGASQPQHYQFVKDHYPALFEKIKVAVKAGNWELQGGMWVEADCNIISGESMVRQLIHGKNFFMDEFGEEVRNLWLPDVFGYSAAMPQILKKSGVDFFLTQKISWNQFNTFPFHLFNWRGIDGTSIVTHFLPEDTYNSTVEAEMLIKGQEAFNENDRCDEFVSLFGVGNGGGGPTEEHIERGLRMQNLEGCPKWAPGKAGDAFARMSELSNQLSTWSGELYLELHRGTLTSQAQVKKCNRLLENRLRAIEFLYSVLPIDRYPADELERIWKRVLLNQFHDILPGSSIGMVYEQTHKEYAECFEACDRLVGATLPSLFEADENALTLINVLSYAYTRPVRLPDAWTGCGVEDRQGNSVPVQLTDTGCYAQVTVPATGCLTLKKCNASSPTASMAGELVLENERVLYVFDENGRIMRGYDKEQDREFIQEQANVFSLYDDHPLHYDAWDIDIYYEQLEIAQAVASGAYVSECGVVRDTLTFELKVGHSTIQQTASLASQTKRIDFETRVDWKEKHRMLRVAFPTTIQTNESTCDIQYGHAKRPTHRNTSWDMAKFEVAAHKYVDLSDSGYGVALLNDCKYGFKILDHVIDMNLLRAPGYPDPTADIGVHEFSYSLIPHNGIVVDSEVIAEANMLNNPPVLANGYRSESFVAPCSLSGHGISLEAVKKAEKSDDLIIRIVETYGRHSEGVLTVADASAKLVSTNMIEWEDGEAVSCCDPMQLKLKPFEILTFKIRTS